MTCPELERLQKARRFEPAVNDKGQPFDLGLWHAWDAENKHRAACPICNGEPACAVTLTTDALMAELHRTMLNEQRWRRMAVLWFLAATVLALADLFR